MNQRFKIRVIFVVSILMLICRINAQVIVEKDLVDRKKNLKALKQFYSNTNLRMDYTDKEIEQANNDVLSIRNKPIIVRLKTNKRQIEAYRNAGDSALAEKIELKTLKTNLSIVSACIRLFNFTKVYFMDVDDKAKFISSDTLVFSHLVFEKDTSIYLPHESAYFLDFGMLYGRSQTNEWKYREYGNTSENSTVIAESAFVLRDTKEKQIAPPTPFYSIVLFQGGKKTKGNLLNLFYDVDLYGPTSNSVIRADFQKSSEYDLAINRMNERFFYCYSLITNKPELENNQKLWLENNPNKYLYPLWINVEKKLLSIQEKAGGQFSKTN